MNMHRWVIPMAITRGRFRWLIERLRVPLILADQSLVSGASFLSTILLARFLGVTAFGRFTLVWIAVLFINSLQFSAIIQPMMSIGVKHAEDEVPAYYGAMIVQQLVISAIAFISLVAGVEASAIVMPAWGIRGLAIPVGVAMFAGQAQDFFRRYLFVRSRPLAALTNDGIRYLGQIALLYAVAELSRALTIATALWVMAATATLGTVHGVLCLEKVAFSREVLKKTIRRHWRLAKWLVPSTLISWGTGHVFLVMAGVVMGAATVGILRAAQAIVGVVQIIFVATDNFAPAHASEIFHHQGRRVLYQYLKRLIWVLCSIILLLLLLINMNATTIIRLAYGDNYPNLSYFLLGFSIMSLVQILIVILHVWVLAIESTEVEFVSWVVTMAFTVLTVYPFITFGGISGFFIGNILAGIIWSATMLNKLLKR